MNCPACGHALTEMTVADVTVDVCRGGCGGLWFDHLELRKLDDADESAGGALLDVPRDPQVKVAHTAPRACPRCGHPAMMRHFYSPRAEVEVDECSKCGGFWLDAGELATLRAQYPSGAERQAASRAFVKTLFAKHVTQMRGELDVPETDGAKGPPASGLSGSLPALGGLLERILRFL